jgi:outer membrane lipoprotein-sorting protein
MKPNFRLASLLALLFLSSFEVVQAQKLDAILDRHVVAMGGKEALSNLKSIRVETAMELMGNELPTSITVVQDRGFISETVFQGLRIVQAIDGKTGWSINPLSGQTEPTPLPAEIVASMSNQIDLTGLYNHREKGYRIELLSDTTVQSAPVHALKLTMKNGVENKLYISKDTYYILLTVSTSAFEDRVLETRIAQSNFQQIDGITYPFTSEITAPGMPGSVAIQVKSVKINPKVDDSIFTFPKKP